MTIDQFIAKLARLRHKKTGKRPVWTTEGERRLLRLNVLLAGCRGSVCRYCPLTAIIKANLNVRLGVLSGPRAASLYLGLTDDDARKIIAAADDALWADRRLRARLLEACGLPAEAK